MAPQLADRKRKALSKDSESEDELSGALDLNGVLSAGEDELLEDEDDGDDSAEDEDEDDDDSNEGDGGEDDADDGILSDDIPSDMDEEEAIQQLLAAKEVAPGARLTPEITEPGVDPKPRQDEQEEGPSYRVEKDANGGVRYVYDEIDPVYDSDDSDAQGPDNTIGNIPLSYYDSYPHIGYDINGKKIMRPATKESLDALLDSIEIPEGFTGLTDADSGNPLNLSREELELISRVQRGLVPEEDYDPYPDMVEYFTNTVEEMPLSARPEPKSRFVPSKHEAKKIMKLVRAIREGRILPYKPPEEREKEEQEQEETYFDLWHDEEAKEPHIMHIPAPKLPPPGFDLSYNPPAEYLPTTAEKKQWEEMEPEEREKEYLPKKFDSLRKVPGYDMLVKERFERCLDLYLAPRVRKNRLRIDPTSLLPKLPRPEDLRPFPAACKTVFHGHEGRVRSLAISPCGEYLASGGDDGTVRVWALHTGRQCFSVKVTSEDAVDAVRWRPTKDAFILAAASGENVFLMVPPVGAEVDGQQLEQTSREILDAGFGYAAKAHQKPTEPGKEPPAKWARPGAKLEDEGVLLRITVRSAVKVISWHRRGDHFTTVSPQGQRRSVIIHTLSQHRSQVPFRKHSGLVQSAAFHPSRPMLFVATQRSVRIYDLQKLELVKTLQPGSKWISSFSIHPQGDNLIVGGYDRKLMWHDLDLDNKPYKSMRFHSSAVRAVRFHAGGLPLFADTSDDGTVQVFHGKPGDYMENPTIVPLKVLRGHSIVQNLGVMDIDWHPREAWIVSAGADGTCRLWV